MPKTHKIAPAIDFELHAAKVTDSLHNKFVIPSELLLEFEIYKLKYWSVAYLGTILDNPTLTASCLKGYNIKLTGCTWQDLQALAKTDPQAQLKLSFRQLRKHWQQSGVVLIKLSTLKIRSQNVNFN